MNKAGYGVSHRGSLSRIMSRDALLGLLVTSLACTGPKGPTPSQEFAGNARLISHVTTGVVSRMGPISVRLTGTFAHRETDPAVLAAAFSFTPPIPGTASWANERTLEYRPRHPMTPGARHTGTIDVPKILPGVTDAGPLSIEFTAAPNRVLSLKGLFELVRQGDPREVVLSGTAEFSDSVAVAQLQASTRLEKDGVAVPVVWEAGHQGFTFRSGPIARTDKLQEFMLRVPAGPFALEHDFLYETQLRPLGELGITDVTTSSDEQEQRITVHFVDPLSDTRDAAAYVTIEPYVETKVTVVGTALHITGAFDRDTKYTLAVRKGVASRWNTTLRENYVREVVFGDLPPQLSFSQTGAFLPSQGQRTIGFRSVNVRRVRVSIMQVFESNLGQFLQEYDLTSAKTRGELWGDLNRVGISVAAETLEIGSARNVWTQSTIDLSPLLRNHRQGLFLVELSMRKDDVLYTCADVDGWIPWENPCSNGYYYSFGTVTKPVIVSDIGLLAKREGDRTLVATTHLGDAKPLPGVSVTLYSYQNQPLETHLTDASGVAAFDSTGGFYLLGEWNGQRSALKFNETGLNLGSFDVGGDAGTAQKTRAFVYAERGVHRPGDPVYLSVIVRDTGELPSGSPVVMKVRNPKNQLVTEIVNREGINGHYAFSFATAESDPTGNWYAEFYTGRMLLARHRLKIETVVPNRLKVGIEIPKDSLGPDDRSVDLTVRSSYLFGAPAANLNTTLTARYMATEKRFSTYTDYRFTTPIRKFGEGDVTLLDGKLGPDGTVACRWTLPPFVETPSAIGALLTARVFEKGGRPATQTAPVLIDPYEVYVGIRELDTRYVKLNTELALSAIALDRHGTPVPGREIKVNIYHNARYWWWQYDDNSSTLKFKTDVSTGLETSFTVVSEDQPVAFTYTPNADGQLLLEVEDVAGGHQSGYFIWASSWGVEGAPMAAGTHLQMECDKEIYRPGDKATVSVRTPSQGIAFFSVEKGAHVVSHAWVELSGTTTLFEVPITRDMLPNAYLTAIVIQPYSQTTNDRPMRLFGTIPLAVEEPGTHLAVEIDAPSELKPRQEFTVTARVPKGSQATVTLAVVDEGLLDLTSFKTPDPWAFFFAKERLSVGSFDIFDAVIGMLWGNVERRFEVGGDEDAFRTRQLGPVRARRFEPVAMFQGPVAVDGQGKARFMFTMPNYMGSVRVMAVACDGDRYGSNDAAVPVREPLVLLPTLPRVIGPGETFTLPATVFALDDQIRDVTVSVRITGPLSVDGSADQRLQFAGKGEQDALFFVKAADAAGVATIRIEAKAGSHTAWVETELAVRPVNPYMYDANEFTIRPGERVDFTVPALGIEGTQRAAVRVSAMPGLRFGNRLARLIRFPYGCVEQTTSSVFPQLFLKDFMAFMGKPQSARHEVRTLVDRNVNEGVDRLRRFQTADGGFAYWQGGSTAAEWATNYAGHFLLEAKAAGYFVPSDMISRWIAFQKRHASGESGDYKTRCYRLYLLALAGDPQLGPMNLMREERLDLLDTVCKWYLAGAYLLSGMESSAAEILRSAGTDVAEYRESGGTYGSALRDKAILLEIATLAGRDETAMRLFDEVNTALGAHAYLSTQESGYCLLAVGKYLKAFWRHDAPVKGAVEFARTGKTERFDVQGDVWHIDLTDEIGAPVSVVSGSSDPLYAVFEWEGIPIEGPTTPESRNLNLEVRWLNEDGRRIDPGSLTQNSVFWCHLRVRGMHSAPIENVALTQIFPSGWEIDNTRLTEESYPEWARSMSLTREDYMDVRDDRVMWFMDLHWGQSHDFLVRLVAVSRGSFVLAPTVAEAMYDNAYRAVQPGRRVTVE